MKKTSLATLLLISAALPVHAVDLQTVYQWALIEDPTLAAADATRLATKEAFPQAIATVLPSISSTMTSQKEKIVNFNNHYDSHGVTLSVQQSLFNAPNFTKIAQSRNTSAQADATFEAAHQDLILRVAQHYFAVLSAEDALTFASGQRQAFTSELNQTKQRFEVGIVSITDVQQAQAAHDSAVAQEISAKNDLANAYENLRQITGSPVEELAPLNTHLPTINPDPTDEETWIDMAEQNNPVLRAARENTSAAKKEIWRQRAQHLPTVNAFASVTHGNTTIQTLDTTTKVYGLSASLNLFSGGSVLSQTRQARADFLYADQTLEGQRRAVYSQTRQAYRGILTTSSEVSSLKQAVASNQSALESMQAAYEAGTRTLTDVITAQTNLLQAKQSLANARYNLILQYLTLKQQAGVLAASDVLEVNQWLKS